MNTALSDIRCKKRETRYPRISDVKKGDKVSSDIRCEKEKKAVPLHILWKQRRCRKLPFSFLCNRKFRFYYIKNAPHGSHCGGVEQCRKCDPPQAENPASRILFLIFIVCTLLQLLRNRGTKDAVCLVWTLTLDEPVLQCTMDDLEVQSFQ